MKRRRAKVDAFDRAVLQHIEEHGWSVVTVGGEDGSQNFAYSVGMRPHGLPELYMTGLSLPTLQFFINEMCGRLLVESRDYQPGDVIDDLSDGGQPLTLVEAQDQGDLTQCRRMFGDGPAWQLVLADEDGRFPWDDGYAYEPEDQPLLGAP